MIKKITFFFLVSTLFLPSQSEAIHRPAPNDLDKIRAYILSSLSTARNRSETVVLESEKSKAGDETPSEKVASPINRLQNALRARANTNPVDVTQMKVLSRNLSLARRALFDHFFKNYVNKEGTATFKRTPDAQLYTKYKDMFETSGRLSDFYTAMEEDFDKCNGLIQDIHPELTKCMITFSHEPQLIRQLSSAMTNWDVARKDHLDGNEEVSFNTFLTRLDHMDEIFSRATKILGMAILMNP